MPAVRSGRHVYTSPDEMLHLELEVEEPSRNAFRAMTIGGKSPARLWAEFWPRHLTTAEDLHKVALDSQNRIARFDRRELGRTDHAQN